MCVKGKVATIKLTGQVQGTIRSVHTVGKGYTNAELERAEIILAVLHGTNTLLSRDIVRTIFFSEQLPPTASFSSPRSSSPSIFSHRPLNSSQALAVQRILSDDPKDKVCLIQGPPGTGKTTVIAACVTSLLMNPVYNGKHHFWLVAQSNVAVKNMAEKLADVGFWDFKLLVSNEFHFDWYVFTFSALVPMFLSTRFQARTSL